MKAIIVLALGVFLLSGAAIGGWVLYNKYIAQVDEASKAPPPPPPKPPSAFIRMAPVVAPLIGENKVEQFITIVVAVEVNADQQPLAQANAPRLSDAFLTTLYGAADERTILRGALVDIVTVKEKLKTAAIKVLGKDMVQDVLVQVVMQRTL